MKFYFWLFLCSLSWMITDAQRVCETDIFNAAASVTDVSAREMPVNGPARDTTLNEIITIPVVVHVLFNNNAQMISDERILSQIAVLNEDYRMLNADASNIPGAFKNKAADAKIMFCLAKVDPQGRPTTGILRRYTTVNNFREADAMKFTAKGGSDAWDSKSYLNIWVCSMFGRAMGYATLPGGDPLKDGVVINYDVMGKGSGLRTDFDRGRTATHEIAHWLGLKHIWGDAECGSDDVADTPAQTSYNFGCPVFPRPSYCSVDADGDMFMNFMDLTNDACMYMFTNGQKNKMRAQFALGAARNSFLRSYRCDGSLASGAPLPQDSLPVEVKKISDQISVYPNPVQNELWVQSKEVATLNGKQLQIFNTAGKLLLSQKLQSNKQQVLVNKLIPGLYFVKILTDDGVKSFKIIKL